MVRLCFRTQMQTHTQGAKLIQKPRNQINTSEPDKTKVATKKTKFQSKREERNQNIPNG